MQQRRSKQQQQQQQRNGNDETRKRIVVPSNRSSSSSSSWRSLLFLAKVFLVLVVAYVVTLMYFVVSLDQEGTNHSILPQPTSRKTTTSTNNNNKDNREGPFVFDREAAELYLAQHGAGSIRKDIMAYVEPPMNDTIPGTGSRGDLEDEHDPGIPPDFVVPLPTRTTTPDDLRIYRYPRFQSCHHDLPAKLPVDRGLEQDLLGHTIVYNVGDHPTPDDYPQREAPYCPVEADPFLPWIHDIFPHVDGTVMEIVAQNKRRCKTGKHFSKDLKRLEPQVSLLQPVSVQRITQDKAQKLAPELWKPNQDNPTTPRYRLAPFEESSEDGMFTRFICRYYGLRFTENQPPQSVMVGETLSIYPFNYEYVSYRKGKPTLITPKGKDTKFFWASVLRFQCPIPKELQSMVRKGETVLSDGTPTLHLEIVPIRTPPRYGTREVYFTEDLAGPQESWQLDGSFWKNMTYQNQTTRGFDARLRWGTKHVLPRVEASGRWSNLPVCQPPQLPPPRTTANQDNGDGPPPVDSSVTSKPHLLSACLWASASFRTRGKKDKPIRDTATRLIEWIEFHLMVGFDHIYVYDNSGAHSNTTSLKPALDLFPPSRVTRIDWPSLICNNNIPAHDNTGERSTQYAAENSCRTRHAPFTEWIASFDTDEYLVPMGQHDSLRDVVMKAQRKKTNILTFRSSRARLLHNFS